MKTIISHFFPSLNSRTKQLVFLPQVQPQFWHKKTCTSTANTTAILAQNGWHFYSKYSRNFDQKITIA